MRPFHNQIFYFEEEKKVPTKSKVKPGLDLAFGAIYCFIPQNILHTACVLSNYLSPLKNLNLSPNI